MTNFGDLENPYDPNHWNRDIEPKHRVGLNTLWFLPFSRMSRYLSNVPRRVTREAVLLHRAGFPVAREPVVRELPG